MFEKEAENYAKTQSYSKEKYSYYEVGYIKLRRGIAYLGIAFPFIFIISSLILRRTEFQPTISHYYCTNNGEWERNLFVGILITVGIFLILYMGYSRLEDWVLNVAGVLAVCIALFPTGHCLGIQGQQITLHRVVAVIFFLCIFFICIFLSKVTLSSLRDNVPEEKKKKDKYARIYDVLSAFMLLAVILTVLGNSLLKSSFDQVFSGKLTFWIETIGILAFSFFWLVKTREIHGNIALGSLAPHK
jgi:uncharacterized membrane protein